MNSEARRLRILIVEDEPVNRSLLRATLSRAAGAQLREASVVEASSLAEARGALTGAGDGFGLVILDVRLPDGEGLELARELAESDAGTRPMVVILTASVLPSEREAAIEAGADAFVAKPYHPMELVAVIERLLGA